MINSSDLTIKEKHELDDISLGALSGGLASLGINIEETILRPFIGGLKDFGFIFTIFSIIVMILSIHRLYCKYKVKSKLYGILIYSLSFIGCYLLLMSANPIWLFLGLILLIISMELVFLFRKGIQRSGILERIAQNVERNNKKSKEWGDRFIKNVNRINEEQKRSAERISRNINRTNNKFKKKRKF
jgi:uncharacterized membrane protein